MRAQYQFDFLFEIMINLDGRVGQSAVIGQTWQFLSNVRVFSGGVG